MSDGPGSEHIRDYFPMFARSLRAANRADTTVATYAKACDQLADYLEAEGMPTVLNEVRRTHVEGFIADLLDKGLAPATAHQRYASLRQFFRWATDEGELEVSPMEKMRPPKVPEQPVDVLADDEIIAMLKVTEGTDFRSRRDHALVRLFIDTGVRLSEMAGLTTDDVDLDAQVIYVLGKGRRHRAVAFGNKASRALDRYQLARRRHPHADSDAWWLGKRGPMSPSGVAQAVKRISRDAGIDHVNPHRFRHTFAHQWLANGGNEGDLVRLAGWADRQMVSRYGASAADERAREAHKTFGPGDAY